jgi:4-diphosphocytidyl-2-C-methyl-D-erythritol kinase
MPLPTAPAKINLFLHVGSARADGYHPVESLAAFADIGDDLHFEPGGDAFSIQVAGPYAEDAGQPANNLVLKAAYALRQRIAAVGGGAFRLTKNLPAGAGLGGGSSDAAAALRLLADTIGLTGGDPALLEAAKETGADVAVCLERKARLVSGLGDVLSEPVAIPALPAVIVYPAAPASTPAVYRTFDRMKASSTPPGIRVSEIPRERAGFLRFLHNQTNDLASAARSVTPEIAEADAALRNTDHALLIRMSGSGSTVFALHETMERAEAEAATIRAKYPRWWVKTTTLR